MSEVVRAVEGPEQAIAALQAKVDALESTVLARLTRRPTGTIEPTFAAIAPAGTLLLQGQTLNRADYPALWKWAQDHGAVTAQAFGPGNGSTTFTLPDMRGRVFAGAGALGVDTYALGQNFGVARHALVTAELAAHAHTAGTGSTTHGHGDTGASGGNHGNHNQDYFNAFGGTVSTFTATGPYGNPGHAHTTPTSGGHTHPVTVDAAGGGAAHENRQPSKAGNWIIYT